MMRDKVGMQEYIQKYSQVYGNLIKHADGYPKPEYLRSIIRIGNIEFEGEMEKETPGSELIKEILLDERNDPVYLQIWGGANTVARALKSIEEDYSETPQWNDVHSRISKKAVLYTILDQDATYREYIAPNWPEVKILYNSAQFWSFAYRWTRVVPAELQTYLGGRWIADNIKFGHGPLMEAYFCWGDGQKISGDPEHTHGDLEETQRRGRSRYDFISEGDSPAYFYLLDVGLGSREDPSYGGWGGRMIRSDQNPYLWEDGSHVTDYNPYTKKNDTAYPQTRWVDVLQNDFASRADWCVMDYESANHPPQVKLNHSEALEAKPGALVRLSGRAEDPDGDRLDWRWWNYEDAGTYGSGVEIIEGQGLEASIMVPENAKPGETIHVILEVTDSGTPVLTRYRRVVIKVCE